MGDFNPSENSQEGAGDPGQVGKSPPTGDQGVQPGVQPTGDSQQTFVTAEQLDQRLNKLLEGVNSTVKRAVQSRADGQENRLSQQIKASQAALLEKFADLESQGVQIPDNIKTRQLERVVEQGLAGGESPSIVEIAGMQVNQQGLNNPEYVNYMGYKMANDYGYIVGQNDPEFQMLKRQGTSTEYLESYREALNAKAARLGQPIPETKPPDAQTPGEKEPAEPTEPGATQPVGGGGIGPSWANENDPKKLIRMGLQMAGEE
jgi:hypothetical protein